MRFLILLIPTFAAAATIAYQTLDRSVIEDRLKAAPSTNQEREQMVRDLFVKAGCPAGALQELPVKHVKEPNVLCTLAGDTERTIVIGAHFDFVRRGKGIIDNWSGAALLPSLLESINKVPRHHRFIFISFTAEEDGMIGSKAYVKSLSPEQLHQISAMVNMDSLATGPTKVELIRADRDLVGALGRIALTVHLPLNAVNVHKVGRSDSDTFQDAGIPAVDIHSITQETFPILHSLQDRITAVKFDDYYDTYKLLAAYLAYLDGKLDNGPSGP